MDYEINDEYETFIKEIESDNFEIGRYLDESNYENEYSHNEIDQAKHILIRKIKEYLHINYPNKYLVSCSWCVFVMTPDKARQSRVSEKTITNGMVD
jgi:hypothetical protein